MTMDQDAAVAAVDLIGRTGARQCTHCRQRITLTDGPGCRYTRRGARWERGCQAAPRPPRRDRRGKPRKPPAVTDP